MGPSELLDSPSSSWVFLGVFIGLETASSLRKDIISVYVLFPSRGERIEGGAESFIPEPSGGNQLYSQVQFFYRCDLCAVVLTESWRWPHQSIFHDFSAKVEWKVKLHIEF